MSECVQSSCDANALKGTCRVVTSKSWSPVMLQQVKTLDKNEINLEDQKKKIIIVLKSNTIS